LEHTARDPDDAAVFPDLDPELDGLPLRVRAEVPALTVSCAASPRPAVPARPPEPETRPAAASTFAPTHHRATNALASVASAIERRGQPQFLTVGKRRIPRYAACERSDIRRAALGRAGETTNQKSSRPSSPPRQSSEAARFPGCVGWDRARIATAHSGPGKSQASYRFSDWQFVTAAHQNGLRSRISQWPGGDRLCRGRKPDRRVPSIRRRTDRRQRRGDYRREWGFYTTGATRHPKHTDCVHPVRPSAFCWLRRKLQPARRQHHRGQHVDERVDAEAAAAPP